MDRRLLSAQLEFADRRKGETVEQTWPNGRHVSLVRTPVADGGFLDTITDITEARAAAARLAHMARHDALTDLPNRVMLREVLVETIANVASNQTAALLCLDLNRFKLVNDTLGHPVGDALVVAVSQRLRSLVRDGDIVAHQGAQTASPSSARLPACAAASASPPRRRASKPTRSSAS
jgi:predicted signal transduction protein with EAL and GGDEF domain